MYAVDITPFENHPWFSLPPAQQATHDNPLCLEKLAMYLPISIAVHNLL